MKSVAFIPARFASARLPGKPLKDIRGKSMIERVYERVRRASLVSDVIVATDDERIVKAVWGFGGKAVLTGECATGTERVAKAARNIPDGVAPPDIVVNVQGDEPLIEPSIIDDCIRALADPCASMSTSMSTHMSTPMTGIKDPSDMSDPNVVKVVTDINGFALYFSRSPIPYLKGGPITVAFKHIGLYAFRRAMLFQLAALPRSPLEKAEGLEQLRALENGFKIKTVFTAYNPVSVDTPEDLERVRGMAWEG
ncbi:MAG: 3-deoxy-manno-octulosonate cytidylyltransferase [Deltaproteobacteria bacterium]|nr:3-deoxy-manno-octulosonate cytidylyltransferase [Deltaproteobacteria bacterium]